MNIDFNTLYNYAMANQIIAIAILIGLVIFLWIRPKIFAKTIFFLVLVIVLLYLLQVLNKEMFSGVVNKKEITTEKRMVDE